MISLINNLIARRLITFSICTRPSHFYSLPGMQIDTSLGSDSDTTCVEDVLRVCNLGFDRLGEKGTCPAAKDFCELIVEDSWLNQLVDVIVGYGISLLRWGSGGVKHPHDMPPSRFPRHQLWAIAHSKSVLLSIATSGPAD
jgi:hypothetical protein